MTEDMKSCLMKTVLDVLGLFALLENRTDMRGLHTLGSFTFTVKI